MTAIVLAGGFGTRLQSVVSDVPKPMAPIQDKPFLDYIFHYLKKNGITNVILSVGYKHETIETYFGNSYLGIDIRYVIEDEPLGTGGAIKKSLNAIEDKVVFVVNGDTFFDVNLMKMKDKFDRNDCQLLLALKEMHDFDRYGCVEVDKEDHIRTFTEKMPRKIGNINGGIYMLRSNIFNAYELPETFSFETFVEKNHNELDAMAMVFDSYFIDIGIPEDYAKAQYELEKHI